MSTRPDDSAFPTHPGQPNGLSHEEWAVLTGRPGLTKREEFAKAAMQGLLANANIAEGFAQAAMAIPQAAKEGLIALAIAHADHLIEALNKQPPTGI